MSIELLEACEEGDTEKVKTLLENKDIDPNYKKESAEITALSLACAKGFETIVALLLEDPRIDPNAPNAEMAPLWGACNAGRSHILQRLLQHPTTSLNPGNNLSYFTSACFTREISSVRAFLQHSSFDLRRGWQEASETVLRQNNLPEILACIMLDYIQKFPTEWQQAFQEKTSQNTNMQLLLNTAQTGDVVALIVHIRETYPDTYHEWYQQGGARLFALTVFLSDGLLRIQEGQEASAAVRFWKAIAQLPMELQMMLCHRMTDSFKELFLSKKIEPEFRLLSATLVQEEARAQQVI